MCVNFHLCLISDKEKKGKNLKTKTEKPLSFQGLKKEIKKKTKTEKTSSQMFAVIANFGQLFTVSISVSSFF